MSQALKGFRAGDQVKAAIVSIDREKGKISFGIKASYFAEEFPGEDGENGEDDDPEEDDEDVDEGAEEGETGDEDEDIGESDVEDAEDIEEAEVDAGEAETLSDEEEGDEEGENEEGDDKEDEGDDEADDDGVMVSQFPPSLFRKLTRPQLELKAPSTKPALVKAATGRNRPTAPASALSVAGGFDWSGQAPASDAESSGSSSDDEDTAPPAHSSTKSKGKKLAIDDLTATAPDSRPETAADFERALLASPNSSFLWIQYMSSQLQEQEVDKAREIGQQALSKISYREEEEKLNVWMALVNLELGFGSEESAEKVFKEAVQYNDARTVYFRYADTLQAAGKQEVSRVIVEVTGLTRAV